MVSGWRSGSSISGCSCCVVSFVSPPSGESARTPSTTCRPKISERVPAEEAALEKYPPLVDCKMKGSRCFSGLVAFAASRVANSFMMDYKELVLYCDFLDFCDFWIFPNYSSVQYHNPILRKNEYLPYC